MAGPAERQELANVERQRQEAGPARVQEFVNIEHQLQMAGPAEMQEFANVERQRQEAGPARVQEFVNIKHQLQWLDARECGNLCILNEVENIVKREQGFVRRVEYVNCGGGGEGYPRRNAGIFELDSYVRRGSCISVNRVAETFQASPASEIWQQIRSGGLEGLVEGGVICFGEFPEAIGESRRLKSWWEERMVVCRKLSDLGGTERGNVPGVKSQSVLSLREAACEHAREIVEPENLTSYEFRIMRETEEAALAQEHVRGKSGTSVHAANESPPLLNRFHVMILTQQIGAGRGTATAASRRHTDAALESRVLKGHRNTPHVSKAPK
ncbi:hypothetical protein R3P38DRAFT_2775699 [Favolaschia claudopus]|uniref:Uncharacterized protein n=1 Tax=Favolaschia claudopus TaxID=2862362 RepID=A0AAV9ZGW6_9AGAR